MKSYGQTIQMRPLQQYFHMVLFIEYVVLTFEFVDEILWCYHSNETSFAVLHMVLFILSIFFHWPLDIRGVIYLLGRSVGLVRSIWTTRAKSET